MKIVIAPDSFKESLSAMQVASEIEKGFRSILPNAEYVCVPVADGGEGTVQSMVDATQGQFIHCEVTSPTGQSISARYGILGYSQTAKQTKPCAVIEMSAASGLHLVPNDRRNPLYTTSYGTGELIIDALNRGVRHIILGLGGSATNDGGAGMMQALGIALLDNNGAPLAPGGAALAKLAHIDPSGMHPQLAQCRFEVACDVSNPLCGPQGASHVFGPQKGASDEMIKVLDKALAHYAQIVSQQGHSHLAHSPGAGAAGGMGFAALAFLQAELTPGVEIVLNTVKLAEQLCGANLVITGEGRLDSQTLQGKTPMGVARIAKAQGIDVIAIAGALSPDANLLLEHGFKAIFSITPGAMPLSQALHNAKENLFFTSQNIARLAQMTLPK